MKKFIILISLILTTSSAFAQPQIEYDDYDNVSIISQPAGCTYYVNDWGFTNYRQGICLSLNMYFPGKWTMQTLTQGVKREEGALRKKHPGMQIYAKIIIHHTDWVFTKKVETKFNGKKFTLAGDTFDQREVISGDHIVEVSWEEINQDSRIYKEFWRPILNNKVPSGTEFITRIYGSHGHITYKETIK